MFIPGLGIVVNANQMETLERVMDGKTIHNMKFKTLEELDLVYGPWDSPGLTDRGKSVLSYYWARCTEAKFARAKKPS